MRHPRSVDLVPGTPADEADALDAAVEIWTDGACKGNPGPGGWGALLRSGANERELFGGAPQTTNNRMELLAVIEALTTLKRRCRVIVHTDSQYVKNGITEWLAQWQRRGWKTADGKQVKNIELWKRLDEQVQRHDVEWRWVRGHSGNAGNERADALANRGVDQVLEENAQLLPSPASRERGRG